MASDADNLADNPAQWQGQPDDGGEGYSSGPAGAQPDAPTETDAPDAPGVAENVGDLEEPGAESGPQPLARVRYGLAKELRLYPDSIVVEFKEEHEETRYNLDSIKRIVLTPGEYNPSKLVLMFDLDDETTVIAAEGMTNVRDFRVLLSKLREIRPQIELEPADMDEQLQQALEIRRRSLLGCYGGFAGICLALWIIYLVVAWVGHVH